jgi:TetR/AcrR family tetracycline transcriptional repressor
VPGAVTLDVAELDPAAPRPDDETRTQVRLPALGGIPADVFSRTAATTHVVAAYNGEEQFRWGLDRLLDGLHAAADVSGRVAGRRRRPV